MKIFVRILAALAAIALVAGAVVAGNAGFQRILDFRALERIPLSTINGALEGEVQLRGRAEAAGQTLEAPKSGSTSLYYDYSVERRETDSDGNESWKEIRRETKATNFALVDATGRLILAGSEDRPLIDWSVPRKFRTREGDLRYTEWRVDPGDSLTVFGWFEPHRNTVDFSRAGQYLPIISGFSAEEERADLGAFALLLLWGGLTALVFAMFAVVYALRLHKTLAFLILVSAASMLYMIHYGFQSLSTDVAEGFARAETQRQRTEARIQAELRQAGLEFPGWDQPIDFEAPPFTILDEATRGQLREWRQQAWLVRARYLRQIDRFPENLYAAVTGAADPMAIPLPPGELAKANDALASYQRTRVGSYVLLVAGGLLVAVGLAWFAFRIIRVKRLQENLAISKTAGIVFGLTEVEGSLVPDDEHTPLTGPVSGKACTWYRYVIKEKRGSGKNAKWVTIEDTIKKQPFWCEDDEGRIRIFPGHAEVHSKHVSTRREGRRHYSETAIRPNDELYVLAKARPDKTRGDRLVLGHEKGSPFIIANIPEAEVMFKKASKGMGLLSLAMSLLFLAIIWTSGASGDFSSLDFLLAALAAPLFLGLVVLILMYNDLVFLKQRCERNWANIQVSLKKRATLIPQLEKVAKEYLDHEASLQDELAALRAARETATDADGVDRYMEKEHASIDAIMARVEAYPDLKGSSVIEDLTNRLIRLENEVALIRAGFNDAVQQYRTRIQTFPDNLLASVFGFRAMDLLHFDRRVHRMPDVSVR